jgi:L-amino acid N-acyltransferase YncA
MDVRVRAVRSDDFRAIADLTNHYILNTPIHFSTKPVTPAELADAWEATRERYPFLVADVDGRFGGFAKASRWREREAYDRTAEVGVYVARGLEGRGIGRALYEALIEALRNRGFHVLVAAITLPNEASVRFHEVMGFEKVGVFRECGWKLGAWRDVAWYQRLI